MEAVAQITPSTAWAFACFEDSEITQLLNAAPRFDRDRLTDLMSAEHAQQGSLSGHVPRLTRTRVPLAPYASGLTLAFGHRRSISSIMVLMRDEGTFGHTDVDALSACLEPIAQALADIRTFTDDATAHARLGQRTPPAHYVLDGSLNIVLAFEPNAHVRLGRDRSLSLPPEIERDVRTIVATWNPDDPHTWKSAVTMPLPQVAVRVFPLSGALGMRIGVSVERYGTRNSLAWAAQRFNISARELQVLALVLQGTGTPEIAQRLRIAESTAHDHIKRMLLKTKSRNRAEMVAKTLGWRA